MNRYTYDTRTGEPPPPGPSQSGLRIYHLALSEGSANDAHIR